MGGDEGSGKTGVFLMLKKIIGEPHCAHIHDLKDIFGEFTAAIMNKIVAIIDGMTCSE